MLLSQVTTLGIGGSAKDFKIVRSEDELINLIKQTSEPFLVIGGGSNLLVNDAGVDKLVIKNEIKGIKHQKLTVIAKSGTILQDLVDYTITHGLSGLQKLTGIPGTLGGAVYGNAGAYGQTISDHIVSVKVLDPYVIPAKAGIYKNNGSRIKLVTRRRRDGMTKGQCNFNYRDSGFKRNHYIILEVTFKLQKADPKTLQNEADEVLSKRLVKYPPGIKCPGSFFKNIVADTLPKEILSKIPKEMIVYGKLPVGSLLEAVGAKGAKEDGIEIASYHANLFVNKGGGTAKAFYILAQKYAQKVKERFGISLEPEVQLISLPPL